MDLVMYLYMKRIILLSIKIIVGKVMSVGKILIITIHIRILVKIVVQRSHNHIWEYGVQILRLTGFR